MTDRMSRTVVAVVTACLSDSGFVVERLTQTLLSVDNGSGEIVQIQVNRIRTELASGNSVGTSALANISDSVSAATESVEDAGQADSESWFGGGESEGDKGKG